MNLAYCTRLHSLRLYGFHQGSSAFVKFVKEITSPIRNLTVDFASNDFEGGIPDFTSLGEALGGRNVASLQRVTVVCHGFVNTNEMISKLRNDMPAVCNRVILEVFRIRASCGR